MKNKNQSFFAGIVCGLILATALTMGFGEYWGYKKSLENEHFQQIMAETRAERDSINRTEAIADSLREVRDAEQEKAADSLKQASSILASLKEARKLQAEMQKQQQIAKWQERMDDSIMKIATEARIRQEVAELVMIIREKIPVVQDKGCYTFSTNRQLRKEVEYLDLLEIRGEPALLQIRYNEYRITDQDANGLSSSSNGKACSSVVDECTDYLDNEFGPYANQNDAHRKQSRLIYYKTIQFWKKELTAM